MHQSLTFPDDLAKQVYVARVEPTVEAIGDKENWEFLTSLDPSGQAVWARGNPAKSVPLFTWNNHTGVVTMTYFAPLKKYIVCVSTPTFSPYTTKVRWRFGSGGRALNEYHLTVADTTTGRCSPNRRIVGRLRTPCSNSTRTFSRAMLLRARSR